MIQAYVDDTGLDGRSPWFIFSALLGTAEDWASVSDAWKGVLEEKPRITYFKMDEAVGLTKQFRGWSETQRDYKLMRLARCIVGEHPILEHTMTTDLASVEAHLRPRAMKPMNEPYFWPFQFTIGSIGLAILDANPDFTEPFEIFFDENDIFGPRAKAWYPIVRAVTEPRVRAILPVEPLFRNDLHTMPLQAADLTAWMSLADRKGANRFHWLREHMTGVGKSPYCVEFGKQQIDLLFSAAPEEEGMEWREAGKEAFREQFIVRRLRHYVPKPSRPKKKHPKR